MPRILLHLFFVLNLFVASSTIHLDSHRSPSSDEILQSLLESLTPERAAEVKTIQSNFMRYMLLAAGEKDQKKYKLFQQSREYVFVELEKVIKNQLAEKQGLKKIIPLAQTPNWSLVDDVQQLTLQTTGKSKLSPEVIDSLNAFFTPTDDLSTLPFPTQDPMIRETLLEILKKPDDKNRALVVVNKFEKQINEKILKIKSIGSEMTRSDALKLDNPDIQSFVRQFLDFYYQEADPALLKNILNDLITHAQQPSPETVVKAMFRNSGPGLGKLLQQIGQEPTMGPELSQLMQSMESDNKKVPLHLIEEIVEKDSGGYKIFNISKDPLGTGTMAQVNKAMLETPQGDQVIALRFLKPGVQDLAMQDIKILDKFLEVKRLTGEISPEMLPSVQKIFKSLQDFLKSELDIESTIQKQLKAYEVYSRSIKVDLEGKIKPVEISVPKVYLPETGLKTELHVQEFVKFGEKFSHLPEHQQKQLASRAIVELWYEEALFNSGYIHADLHQGNFTVLVQDGSDQLKVTIFDFGMSDILDQKTRRAFLLLGAGSEYSDTYLISKGFQTMMEDQSQESFKSLHLLVKNELKRAPKDATSWIIWGLQNGVVHSEQLGALARGSSLVQQLPKLIGEETIAKKILEQAAAKKARGKFFSRHFDFPLKRRELLRLGGGFVKKSCQDLIGAFFK